MGFLTSYCIHASACFDFLDPGDVIFPPNYSRTGDRESFMHLRSLDPFCTPPYPQIGHHPLCFPFYIPLFSFHPHPHTSCSSVLYVLPCLRVGGVKISNPSYALPCANLVLLNKYYTLHAYFSFSQFAHTPNRHGYFPLLFDSEAILYHIMATDTDINISLTGYFSYPLSPCPLLVTDKRAHQHRRALISHLFLFS